MDQPEVLQGPKANNGSPTGPQLWTQDIAAGEADLAAGRVNEIDIEALCLEIEADADEMELQRKGGLVSRT